MCQYTIWDLFMKKILLIVLSCLFYVTSYSQKIYFCKYPHLADIKVFVTDYSHQADWLLYMVKYPYEAKKPGCWYIVKYPYLADKRVYVVKYPYLADKKIYFVSYKSRVKLKKAYLY